MGGKNGNPVAKPIVAVNEPDPYFYNAVSYTYQYLLDNVALATTPAVRDLLLVHTMRGRAMNGHWSADFLDGQEELRRYPNTITEEIIDALGMSIPETQRACQDIIDDIVNYALWSLEHLENPRKNGRGLNHGRKLINSSRQPLAGNERFSHYLVHNPVDVLKGIYIAGMVDNNSWRKKTQEKYGINIHQGQCVPVHLQTAREQGITLEDMARMGSNPQLNIRDLIKSGVVSDRSKETARDGYVSGFVELQSGQGVSDDAVYLTLLLLFNEDVANGFLLGDAIDTWDKCVPKIILGGQDEDLASRVFNRYKKLTGERLCNGSKLMYVIYLSAINGEKYPSCSQKRFMQIDQTTGLTAIESHLMWVDYLKNGGEQPPAMKIGYQQVPNLDFYARYLERYNQPRTPHIITLG